jgi:5'-methylthioadenosine phosphorylase
LKPEIKVASLVVPDDLVDETGRNDNFYGLGIVVHAQPKPAFSKGLRNILLKSYDAGFGFNGLVEAATYVCIPGDRFGTKAEGKKRAQYADIVGMTICPEASMAMQLGLHYAVIAIPVDDDLDANHEGKTLEVMSRLSESSKLPAYMAKVLEATLDFAKNPPLLPQLKGNIIPGDTRLIKNENLRDFARELIDRYC